MNGEYQEHLFTPIKREMMDELLSYCSRHGIKKAEFVRRAIADKLRVERAREMEPLNSERPL